MSVKLWKILEFNKDNAAKIAEEWGIDPFLCCLLEARGINTPEKIDEFLFSDGIYSDPYFLPDMENAVDRIRLAIKNKEKIAIFGDYDADGVTATAILYKYLKEECGADVICRLPERLTEGYGISKKAVKEFKNQDVKLIITVDNGISAFDAVEYAKELFIDVIITDHHLPSDKLPSALAVIDAHRKDCKLSFKDFCGAGIALKLVSAISGDSFSAMQKYSDIAAIGTLADIVSMLGENRNIVKVGIEKLKQNANYGIKALSVIAGVDINAVNSEMISFVFTPRINAAGRMGTPINALKLLIENDSEKLSELAEIVNSGNVERRNIEKNILIEATSQVEENSIIKNSNVIVVCGKNWHLGVIGIVAARLVSVYGKPALVLTETGGELKGSARSIDGFSMYEALSYISKSLVRFGGHEKAAGLTAELGKIDEIRAGLSKYAQSIEPTFFTETIDFKLKPESINIEFCDKLKTLEPFGEKNEKPVFGLFNLEIISIFSLSDGKYLKLQLKKGDYKFEVPYFLCAYKDFPYKIGDKIDLCVNIDKSVFRGVAEASIKIKDIRFSQTEEINDEFYLKSERVYEKFKMGSALTELEAKHLTPSREFLTELYRFFVKENCFAFDVYFLCKRIGCPSKYAGKLFTALDIFCESEIIIKKANLYSLNMVTAKEKQDLKQTNTFLELSKWIKK